MLWRLKRLDFSTSILLPQAQHNVVTHHSCRRVSMELDSDGGAPARNMVDSLPRGMPKVVDCWQTGAQATN